MKKNRTETVTYIQTYENIWTILCTGREFSPGLVRLFLRKHFESLCDQDIKDARPQQNNYINCISVYYAAVQGCFTTEAFHISQNSSSNLVPQHKQSWY